MPIYAYRCSACGHAKDVLQRMSDPVLSTCPACAAETFTKQLTAAGFQLKGSGWYVTDFKGGGAAAAADAKSEAKAEGASGSESTNKSDAKSESESKSKSETKSETKSDAKTGGKSDSKPAAAPATTTPSSQSGGSGAGH